MFFVLDGQEALQICSLTQMAITSNLNGFGFTEKQVNYFQSKLAMKCFISFCIKKWVYNKLKISAFYLVFFDFCLSIKFLSNGKIQFINLFEVIQLK